MRVLVTDGDNRAALAVTRSLGRRGHTVVVADRQRRSLAQTSRYCAAGAEYPDPATDEGGFLNALLSIVRSREIEVLLPIADITTTLVAEHRARFEPSCAVPLAPASVIANASDKVEILRRADRLGVPFPKTVLVPAPSDAGSLANALPFPVVVKPRRSRVRTSNRWIACSVSYANTPEELLQRLKSYPEEAFPVILQERIEGPGVGVFMCYAAGQAIAEFSHRRIREKPPSGGVSVLSESVELGPDLRRFSRALLDDLRWHGVAMVEFKIDRRDRQPKLMEINGRFWGSLQLAIDAGVDFPAILLSAAHDGVLPPTYPYRAGVRCRWFWGDVDSLFLQLFPRIRIDHQETHKVRAMVDFLRFWGPNLHYENPRRSDLRPWLYETAQWLRRMAISSDQLREPRP